MDREDNDRNPRGDCPYPEVNPTARVTALRALKEFPEPPALDELLYNEDNVLPMTGRDRRTNKRLRAEQ